ncbi:sensor domain-containing protein [Mycolicibacterium mengxianglii]|uniref:sensor domain-containing protein n=1 Tax=Mycolicibacterium mengxianglii TaxID=2736649 RepID=UPI0018EF1EC6|nr:sensor domain-containing protein [Mycolicibacterium mengxianglii]
MARTRRIPCLVAAVVACCVAGCSTTVPGAPVAEGGNNRLYRDVTVNDLPQLLLKPADFDDILSTAHMAISDTSERAVALDPGQTVTGDASCLGAAFSAMANVYRGTGYITALGQRIADPGDSSGHIAFQFVALYPPGGGAERFRRESETTWRACAGKPISIKQSDSVTDTWTIGETTAENGVVSVVNLQEGGDGWACSRSLGARANIVADVAACGEDESAGSSATIVSEILDKIPN